MRHGLQKYGVFYRKVQQTPGLPWEAKALATPLPTSPYYVQ